VLVVEQNETTNYGINSIAVEIPLESVKKRKQRTPTTTDDLRPHGHLGCFFLIGFSVF
jgi:hypothetical protein